MSLGMRGCKNWNSQNLLLKRSNYWKACSASVSQSTECLIPDFHPELLSGALKFSSCSGHDLVFVDVDGKCQFSFGRVPFLLINLTMILRRAFHDHLPHSVKNVHSQVWQRFC